MNPLRIAAIVEGDGEVTAVPALIRRLAASLPAPEEVVVAPVIRRPASKLIQPGELERTVELCARQLGRQGGVLVLLDCEDDCPAVLAPRLLARIRSARPDLPTSLVLAHREYEAWFLAAAESLRGRGGLPADLVAPDRPESIRGCKEWLADRMESGARYRETEDQARFSRIFDMRTARVRSGSFDKCHREVAQLLQAVKHSTAWTEIASSSDEDRRSGPSRS